MAVGLFGSWSFLAFYTQQVDHALAEIERLPGRHLYFLDDHLLGHRRFASALFEGMRGMNRLFARASFPHGTLKHQAKHFFCAAGWKKIEPLWDLVIRAKQLRQMTPLSRTLPERSRPVCDGVPQALNHRPPAQSVPNHEPRISCPCGTFARIHRQLTLAGSVLV